MPTITETSKIKYSRPASQERIRRVKAALETNGFKVKLVDNLDALHTAVLKQIPSGSEVFTATSVTLDKANLTETLNDNPYVWVRNMFMPLYGIPDKELEMKRLGSASDYAIGSVHALTEDGQAVIASASGSQIPNYVYGAKNYIWVVGSQKIVENLDEALDRVENYSFHLEDERAKKAYGFGSSINKVLIYRKETAGRGTIYIIREAVGF
ncbi:MAG TPA: LUD domain-containing protein [Candidatus Saccharimonadales bacterium]|nr:LUD domain-containing protein [Candidatus Saccharimonadales bacterium]